MKSTRILFLVAGILIVVAVVVGFQMFIGGKVYGTYEMKDLVIEQSGDNYTLFLDERTLKLSERMYEKKDWAEDYSYKITYSFSLFNKNSGKVERLGRFGENYLNTRDKE